MAQSGYTPIQLYRSATASAAPVAGNLTAGEIALNYNPADMALYAKNSGGSVIRIMNNPSGLKYPTVDGTSGQLMVTDGAGNLSWVSVTSGTVTGSGTTNYVPKFTGSTALGDSSIYINGNNDAVINTITVGRGSSSVSSNTALGYGVLSANTTGAQNTAVGYNSLHSNTSGTNNVSLGYNALGTNTTGSNNVALGTTALYNNNAGNNVAVGVGSLFLNSSGNLNVAIGFNSLNNNYTGDTNTAIGGLSLYSNTTGSNNTAIGCNALYFNSVGVRNTALGYGALYSNTTNYNTAVGYNCLNSITTATGNTAMGYATGVYTTGANNSYFGYSCGTNGTGGGNCALGAITLANLSSGAYNIALGYASGNGITSGSGNISIGNVNNAGSTVPAFNITTQNNYISLGTTSVTNAYIQVAWTVVSDARDKTNFGEVPHGLDFVSQLNPVSYQFKMSREDDTPNGNVRYGFKAQDVLALEGENSVIIDAENPDKLYYNSDSLVPVLVNAIKELKAELDAIKFELSAIKSK